VNSRRVWPRSINRDATTLIAVTDSTMPRNAAWSGGAPNSSHAKPTLRQRWHDGEPSRQQTWLKMRA
jgi:hypothetical protein